MKQTSLNRVGGADETRKRKGELLQVGRFLYRTEGQERKWKRIGKRK